MPNTVSKSADVSPKKQLWMASRLGRERKRVLRDALRDVIAGVGARSIDLELHAMVGRKALDRLAQNGLRGEVLFPVPVVLGKQPSLAGYYRLVLGISGKDYGRRGMGKWIEVEQGKRSDVTPAEVKQLCDRLIPAGETLLREMDQPLSKDLFHELSLLTLGAQLDGGYRTVIGQAGVAEVRRLIEGIVAVGGTGVERKGSLLAFRNAAGRPVEIRFGADPYVVVTEFMGAVPNKKLAVEVKGGTDVANIHNRLGEAEKSHLKLKAKGIVRWTILGVAIDDEVARQRSPSTDRFFVLSDLSREAGAEYEDFERGLRSVLSLK
jgi:hypothetical protein